MTIRYYDQPSTVAPENLFKTFTLFQKLTFTPIHLFVNTLNPKHGSHQISSYATTIIMCYTHMPVTAIHSSLSLEHPLNTFYATMLKELLRLYAKAMKCNVEMPEKSSVPI